MTRQPLSPVVLLTLLASCNSQTRPAGGQGSLPTVDRWVSVTSLDTATIAVDSRSILRTDSNDYRVWVRWTFNKPQAGEARTQFRSYNVVMQRTDLDCASTRMKVTDVRYYDSLTSLGAQQISPSSWIEVVPGTVGEDLIAGACREARRHSLQIRH